MKTLQDYEIEPIDEDDDIYTVKEFLKNVDCGGFIDDDGMGELSDGKVKTMGSAYWIYPSSIRENLAENPWATHVVWYNK